MVEHYLQLVTGDRVEMPCAARVIQIVNEIVALIMLEPAPLQLCVNSACLGIGSLSIRRHWDMDGDECGVSVVASVEDETPGLREGA